MQRWKKIVLQLKKTKSIKNDLLKLLDKDSKVMVINIILIAGVVINIILNIH